MVEFLPFKGLVPQLGEGEGIGERVSPPYDVIGQAELGALQARPFNISRVTLGGVDGDYQPAARLFSSWLSSGRLKADDRECFYALRQTFSHDGRTLTRTGLMGALALEPYEAGNIAPHEETFPKVKEDRLRLLQATEAHLESIFCLYDRLEPGLLAAISGMEPIFQVRDGEGTLHEFGRIDDPSLVARLREELRGKRLLIADGHHRYETALRYSQEHPGEARKGYVLATLVAGNDPGLTVMPTHRIFKGVGISTDEFLFHSAKFFAIWEVGSLEELLRLTSANERTALGVLMPGGHRFVFELAWRPTEDPLWSVDAYVCQELIQHKILEKKGEVTVEYDHDARSVEGRMSADGVTLAAILTPPQLDLIWSVAREGERMPKKSTYFYPKVWSGFVALDLR